MKKHILIAAAVMLAAVTHGQMFAQMFGQTWTPASLSPVAWWKMDSTNSGYFADNISGKNLTCAGNPKIVSGVVGNAASFNEGATGQTATNGTFSITGQVCTLSFWMWWGTNTTAVAIEYSPNFNFNNAFMFQADNSVFAFAMSSSSGTYNGGRPTTLPTHDEWHHYVVTMNRGTTVGGTNGVSMWIDGVSNSMTQIFTNNLSASTFSEAKGLYIATRNGTLYPFSGKFDDFQVFNRALTQSEITQLYNWRQ
jgi:hypothetical protein